MQVQPRWKSPRRQGGFTLVEVGIVLAIMALAAAVIIPGMNNLSRGDLRKAASGMAATIRSCYDDAALQGQTYRMTLMPGQARVVIEATEAAISFDEEGGAVVAAQAQDGDPLAAFDLNTESASPPPPPPKKKQKESKGAGGASPLAGLVGINKLSEDAAGASFHKVGTYELPKAVRILDIWTDGMEAATTELETYLYFFASGYTQDALIHLEDSENRVFSVKVSPLTGRSKIESGYIEVPK